ncbi:hypothetical protein SYNPS1DRAFT_26600 [Syncephalis pseudoplumigaleata]|uniref:Uncharacterized protein n=1 Tax=Syncephalis pseudoplumigaleata TaxID=1712513 RepID=A0A4P9Z5D3_9FUNG|nr:hypothetical protein SYNPS1DRAFT_26600 [Syncephalis pseudoplumigaleata]|eukprot:RKP27766.1 hypothetical protein SYNPS1DRAFT_26600 [Syncephalis pseudoplumigaleata]
MRLLPLLCSSVAVTLLHGVLFAIATPQQQQPQPRQQQTPAPAPASPTASAAPRQTGPATTCVSCPPIDCKTPCGANEICVLTAPSCDKCPTASCQPEGSLFRNAQSSMAAEDESATSSKIVPIAIGGVCGGLGVAAAIAGLIWYRQRRRASDTQQRYGAQHNTAGVYAGSHQNTGGMKSNYAASRQTGFSDENASVMDEHDRFSISRPPTTWGGYHAALGATEELANITSMNIGGEASPAQQPHSDDSQLSHPYMAASLNSRHAYEHSPSNVSTANASLIGGTHPPANPPPPPPPAMTLGAMVAAATAAVAKEHQQPNNSVTGRMISMMDRQQQRISMAESTRTDNSDQIEVTRARLTTVKPGQSVMYVDNVENFITPTGQISRSATLSERSYRRDDQHASSFDATLMPVGVHDSLFPGSNTTQVLSNLRQANYHDAQAKEEEEEEDGQDPGWPRTSFAHNVFSSLPESTGMAQQLAATTTTTTQQRPESEVDPSNALYNLARAVAEEDAPAAPMPKINCPAEPSAVVDVTIQIPDSIRAVMEASDDTPPPATATQEGTANPSDTNSGYWQWRQQMIDSAREAKYKS